METPPHPLKVTGRVRGHSLGHSHLPPPRLQEHLSLKPPLDSQSRYSRVMKARNSAPVLTSNNKDNMRTSGGD